MAGQKLSDDELREAAAEAGISPRELRIALAERAGGSNELATSTIGPPERGATATYIEGRLTLERDDALVAVKSSIERQTGRSGHKQSDDEADIVDDEKGLTYRIRTADDGGGGSLVRIDVDPSQGQGNQALATTGVVGMSATMIALGWLFGVLVFWIGGLAFGAVGGLLLARSVMNLRRSTAAAHGIAAQALMEAEDGANEPIAALPQPRQS